MSLNLPPNVCLLESQVAGHTIESVSQKYGMLRDKSGASVFKPLSKPVYAEREISFYKQAKEAQTDINQKLPSLLIPRYEGDLEMVIDGKKQLFIKMENLTHSMEKPCVMDIKVGRRTWDPLATSSKIEMEEQKYAACKNSIGLCIPGFQIYSPTGECLKFGKEYGKALNEKTFCDTLILFLTAQKNCYKPLVKTIINQLYSLQKWFTAQTSANFYSSSVLIAYDYGALQTNFERKDKADLDTYNGFHRRKKTIINSSCIPWVKVKMIDFAHVFDTQKESCDANYLFGLQNLIFILQQILIEHW